MSSWIAKRKDRKFSSGSGWWGKPQRDLRLQLPPIYLPLPPVGSSSSLCHTHVCCSLKCGVKYNWIDKFFMYMRYILTRTYMGWSFPLSPFPSSHHSFIFSPYNRNKSWKKLIWAPHFAVVDFYALLNGGTEPTANIANIANNNNTSNNNNNNNFSLDSFTNFIYAKLASFASAKSAGNLYCNYNAKC